MAFEAKYEGECPSCEWDIIIGELIRYEGGKVVHDVCPTDEEIARVRAARARPICPTCWLVEPCDCEPQASLQNGGAA